VRPYQLSVACLRRFWYRSGGLGEAFVTRATYFCWFALTLLVMQQGPSMAGECPKAEYNNRATVSNGDNALDLSNMRLHAIPPRVFEMTDLEELDLSENELTELPKDILRLTKLRVLVLEGKAFDYSNHWTALPPWIGDLGALEVLDLGDGKFSSLPPEIGKLTKLRYLNLYRVPIRRLPQEFASLEALEELQLGQTKLEQFPPELLARSFYF
jgi:hypothetical protein